MERSTTKDRSEERVVRVVAGPVTLEGNLTLPAGARGVVLFAHGSGSSRQSPRNRAVAAELPAELLTRITAMPEGEYAVDEAAELLGGTPG